MEQRVSTDQPDLPERFDLRSADPLAERIDVLRGTFPEAFRDGKVDIDALTRSLGEWVDPGPERFGLTWPGKAECMRVIQEQSLGALVPMPEESVDWDTTQNVIIEGENLEVLKLLQKAYHGKVKMIYIDPPYNTGKEFIYPDNFREGLADYLKYSGQVDDAGLKISANTETGGRYHSKWLSMMYPRLFLARNLLTEDGLVFVSIDDHEYHSLRFTLDEVFGEENYLGSIVWQAKRGGGSDSSGLVQDHEYVVIYARLKESCELGREDFESAPLDREDELGPYRRGRELNKWGSNSLRIDRPTMFFPIPGPTGPVYPIRTDGREGCWRKGKTEMLRLAEGGEIDFVIRSDGRLGAFEKVRTTGPSSKPYRTWSTTKSTTADGTKRLKSLFEGATPFPYPKPPELMKNLLDIGIGSYEDALVLDFFAGSGTLGDAVVQFNAERSTRVNYLLVQLPEPTGNADLPKLSSITRMRLQKVANEAERAPKLDDSAHTFDKGFRAFRLAASGFKTWTSQRSSVDSLAQQLTVYANNIELTSEFTGIVAELLLKSGFPLSASTNPVGLSGDTAAHSVAEGALLIYTGNDLTVAKLEEMISLRPSLIIVLDGAFVDDEAKVNALQTVRAHNRLDETDLTLRIV